MGKGKLVRDRIPERMAEEGLRPKVVRLSDEKYKRALIDKLVEEVEEVNKACKRRNQDDIIEECGDVLETLEALLKAYSINLSAFERARKKKYVEKGGFEDRYFLKS